MADLDYLRRTLDTLHAVPKWEGTAIPGVTLYWDQTDWHAEVHDRGVDDELDEGPACGTGMCCAGWMAHLDPTVRFSRHFNAELYRVGEDGYHLGTIRDWAIERLGVTESEGSRLFAVNNSLDDLEEFYWELCDRYGVEPLPVGTYPPEVTR
jgi:hypothetical protein